MFRRSRLLVVALCAAVVGGGADRARRRQDQDDGGLSVTKSSFGTLPPSMGGTAIDRYTLRNGARHVGVDHHLRRDHPGARACPTGAGARRT